MIDPGITTDGHSNLPEIVINNNDSHRNIQDCEDDTVNHSVPNNFPSNATLRGIGENNTVVFHQVRQDSDPLFTQNPIAIANALSNVVPENLLQDVRINRRRNVVAVELKQTGDRDSTMRTLLEITRLGAFTVKAHKPAGLSTIGIHKSGVISPVPSFKLRHGRRQ